MEKEARKTMRVAVYCRLARADQDDTLLEVQKERLRIYAKERGYDIVAEIAEIGSGLSLNRPGIREMAALAHRHMIDAVLVSDISRLCRDCGQTLRLEGKLKKQGVSIESMKDNPLPGIPEGQNCAGLYNEIRQRENRRFRPAVFFFALYCKVPINSSSRAFCFSVSVLHFAKSSRCSSVISTASPPSAKNCAKVIPNARQITSSVGSVGALFLLKTLVIVE